MSFWSSLKTILLALPALVRLVDAMASWLKSMYGENPAQAIEAHAEAFKMLREAKTSDEKARAAAAISALIRRL